MRPQAESHNLLFFIVVTDWCILLIFRYPIESTYQNIYRSRAKGFCFTCGRSTALVHFRHLHTLRIFGFSLLNADQN